MERIVLEKNNQPLVSIVIPCYNHEQFVQDCIQSVIDQTYENIELIIIDDGSKDNSVLKIQEMVEKCQNRFKRFEFRYRPNKGLSATLNEAIDWCCGKYFSAIASDDMLLEEKTKTQLDYMEDHSSSVAVFGGVHIINNENKVIRTIIDEQKKYTFNEILMHQHNLPAPTAFIQRESLIRVGKYDPEIRIEDWYMWLKISKIGEIVYLPKAFSYYRDHLDNTTKKSNIMSVERFKVISNFSNDKNYSLAKQQVGWINCLEENYTGRWEKFFSKCFYLIRNPAFFLYKLTGKL
ncbi:glycosyltransferase [Acinetobacter sp. ANC 4862]|nr:glycosyltransferase [Acinetobacter sp. ANC 4862]